MSMFALNVLDRILFLVIIDKKAKELWQKY